MTALHAQKVVEEPDRLLGHRGIDAYAGKLSDIGIHRGSSFPGMSLPLFFLASMPLGALWGPSGPTVPSARRRAAARPHRPAASKMAVAGAGTGAKVMPAICHPGTKPIGSPVSSLGVTASSVTRSNAIPGSATTPRKNVPPRGFRSAGLPAKTQGGSGH